MLANDRTTLSFTRVVAPMAGTVVSLTAVEGQTLNANQTTPIILRIADLSRMRVVAQVSEADQPRLTPGMPVRFHTLGRPERRYEARLQQILPTPEVVNNVVLYAARFEVPNADGALLPQMSAQVFFVRAEARDVRACAACCPVRLLASPWRAPANGGGAAPRRQHRDARPAPRRGRPRARRSAGRPSPGERVVIPRAPARRRPAPAAGGAALPPSAEAGHEAAPRRRRGRRGQGPPPRR